MAKVSSAREDLLSAAVELFRARGYEGVGVAELLEKSGAPRGSLYFHFPGGKEQIGAEVVERVGRSVAARLSALHQSGVPLERYIDLVFEATALEAKERCYTASCPMAAIAGELSPDSAMLGEAVRASLACWEEEITAAAMARGISAADAPVFASAMVTAIEGAYLMSKAQASSAAHLNIARAMRALAAEMR